jgi:hypothetical protein
MAPGFYGQGIFDSNRLIQEMMREDERDRKYQRARYLNVSPQWAMGYDMGATTYTEPPHRCKEVPKRLESYYHQLLNYHYQRDPGLRRECEKICCALKRCGVRY